MNDFLNGLSVFLKSRAPLPVILLLSAILYYAPALTAYFGTFPQKRFPVFASLPGFFSVVFMLLGLRMADDLSDIESDRLFYPSRPLPSGKTGSKDVTMFILLSVIIMLGLNLAIGRAGLFMIAVIVVLYAMYYGVIKKKITNPFINALAVNLVFFFIPFYAAGVTANRVTAVNLSLGLFLYSSVMAHEISHNIKSPIHEREGLKTFSALWGGRKAALISFALFLFSALTGIVIFVKGRFHFIYLSIYLLSVLGLSCRYRGFIARPGTEISEKFYREGFFYPLAVFLGIIIDSLYYS